MSTYEFTATITAAGQIEVPSEVAVKLPVGKEAQVIVTVGEPMSPLMGTPVKELLKYVGTIPAKDLEEMQKAIEEEFETIEPDEWQ